MRESTTRKFKGIISYSEASLPSGKEYIGIEGNGGTRENYPFRSLAVKGNPEAGSLRKVRLEAINDILFVFCGLENIQLKVC